jgi:multiple sugar transport system substrate-binding protein
VTSHHPRGTSKQSGGTSDPAGAVLRGDPADRRRSAGGRSRRRARPAAVVAALAMSASLLAACGEDDGIPTLTWYINPDSGGQEEIARRCTEEAGGRYRIAISQLPRESSEQRQQLVRRLAAEDNSIDIMSLDPPYVPEFAQAGFLAPVPADVAQRVSEGVVQVALAGSQWDGELVVVPFWANTQLFWYRRSVAEAAGLDVGGPVTWEQVIEAAQSQNVLLGAQGIRAEALTVWFNALIESAGGAVITGSPEDPEAIELGLTEPPAVRAAEIMRAVADAGVAGPAFSTSGEDASVIGFESPDGGFMVNWPFVWPRALAAVEGGTLDASVPEDYGWGLYPQVEEGEPSRPPYGGINLGIGAYSKHPDLAYEAAECATSLENQTYYFITNGNPAARAAAYDDPEVLELFPMAPVIRESLEQAAPRPLTAYYSEVSSSIQRLYHPPSAVQPGRTGEEAADLIRAVLRKERLL